MPVPGQIVGPERVGQQLAQRPRPAWMIDQKTGPAVLEEHLTTPSAGHQNLAVGTYARQGDKTSAAGRM